jgi:hypothetical protein
MNWSDLATWPVRVVDWATLAALVLGAPWALLTFRRNSRIKAAELLLKLEEECRECLPTLLAIEYLDDYKATYEPALAKSTTTKRVHYTAAQSKAIDQIERVLRHFLACDHVRRLGVDAGALDRAYRYYLAVCVSEQRQELRRYLRTYWPTVFFWAERAGAPWPKRVWISARQLGPRLKVWWHGVPRGA